MIEKVQAYRCFCWCGHRWISEVRPKRCAKCKSRKWNSDSEKAIAQIHPENLDDIFGKETSAPIKSEKSCSECFALNGQHQKTCAKAKKKK